MFRIPELLAPAGGMTQLRAAAENGADAVYMGGKLFNARINAANFTDAEMKEAIAYARLKGVRLYVTMNTLIKDSELSAALEYAAFLYNEGADALIIQDLGFAELVKRYIPDFQLHLSTQGTVYNIEGARAAKRLGFSRVVAAREMTLEEIREITGWKQNMAAGKDRPAEELPEIEVFVHGALCICYSGQCQMSREIGGRSGNRGECAQPCRLTYSVYREDKGNSTILHEAAGPCYALSPKDLCAVEHLGPLASAGVSSLKIEGRMKSPEYVAVVTGIYRKYLDLYAKYGQYRVEPADLKDLSQIFSRGGSTAGFLFGNPGKNLMSRDLSKHQGIYIGKVISSGSKAGNAGNRQRGLITVQLADKLSLGDGVEIRNRELPGNLVTFMLRNGKKADSAGKGDFVTIGYIDGMATPGDKVYKISDKALMERARTSYEAKSGSAKKALRKQGVAFHFTAGLSRPVSLCAASEGGACVTKELAEPARKALTKALTLEAVEAQLDKTGGTPFRMTKCTAEIEEDVSVPLSGINELRRAVLKELEALVRQSGRIPVRIVETPTEIACDTGASATDSGRTGRGLASESMPYEEEMFLYLYRAEREEPVDSSFRRIYVPYDAMLDGFYRNDARAVPVIPNITKGRHDAYIRNNFDEILTIARNGIAVGNIGWIEPFASAGIRVIGDYGLNLFNSMDFMLAKRLGVREAVLSHEADPEDILKMNFWGVIPEVIIKGRIPLMTSELCLAEDGYFLKDRKGQFYPVLTDSSDRRSTILSYKGTDLSGWKEALKKAGVRRFRVYI